MMTRALDADRARKQRVRVPGRFVGGIGTVAADRAHGGKHYPRSAV